MSECPSLGSYHGVVGVATVECPVGGVGSELLAGVDDDDHGTVGVGPVAAVGTGRVDLSHDCLSVGGGVAQESRSGIADLRCVVLGQRLRAVVLAARTWVTDQAHWVVAALLGVVV